MALFTMRDSWNVWRRKVNEAINAGKSIDSKNVVYDGTSSGVSATNVQGAIDEVAGSVENAQSAISEIASSVEDNTTDITNLKAKAYKYDTLWSGDASGGGNKELAYNITNYDAVMIYYNNGYMSATIPMEFFKARHPMRVQVTNSGVVYTAGVTYEDDTHISVMSSQDSIVFFIGIKYHS